MSLMLDQEKIIFNGKVIGKMKWDGANTQVHFTLKYKASPDDAIVPISYLATGLAIILNKKPSGPQIAVTSSEDDVRWVKRAVRTLTEKPVTRDGLFHKNHADHWPSDFHGHDYENHLKLDLVSGEIYDVGTRKLCGRLKKKKLKVVRDELKKSNYFKLRVDTLNKTSKG